MRGGATGGEVCEIAGVGLVNIEWVRELIGSTFLTAIVKRGKDILTVAHLGRHVPAEIQTALSSAAAKSASKAVTSAATSNATTPTTTPKAAPPPSGTSNGSVPRPPSQITRLDHGAARPGHREVRAPTTTAMSIVKPGARPAPTSGGVVETFDQAVEPR